MGAGSERVGRRRPLLARTALPALLLLLTSPLVACDRGHYSSLEGERASAGGAGAAGAAGAAGMAGSLTIDLGGVGPTPGLPEPCHLPAPSQTVFGERRVSSTAPARRELYTWTTTEQAQELRAGAVLFTRTERAGLGPGFAMEVLSTLAQKSPDIDTSPDTVALAALLSGPAFAKARYTWSEPWATRAAWPGETYGDQLVRIVLRPEAWLARFDGNRIDVVDMSNQPVAVADALAHPERVAGVYFVRVAGAGGGDGPRCYGSFRGGDDGYREVIIGNEAMVEEWSLGTPEIRARIEADRALVEEFFQRIRPCPSSQDAHRWNIDVVCNWSSQAATTEIDSYEQALAIPSPCYVPQPAALAELMKLLEASLFEPDPFVVRPEP